MAGRSTERRERAPSRRRVERAIRKLKEAIARRPDEIRERLRVARAYRVIGEVDQSRGWYRDVTERLAARGDALKAIAVTRELLELAPTDTNALLTLAKLYARSARARGDHHAGVAVPLGPARQRIVRPLQPLVDPATVLDAAELLVILDGEELGAEEERRKAGGKAQRPAAPEKEKEKEKEREKEPDPGPDASGPRRASQVFQALIREATGVHKLPGPPVPQAPPPAPAGAFARGSTATPGRPDHGAHRRNQPAPATPAAAAPKAQLPATPAAVSPRVRPEGPPPPLPPRADAPARAASRPARDDAWDEATLTIDVAALAALARDSSPEPVEEARAARALSRVPLFGQLGKAAFIELTRGVVLRPVPGGTFLFEEGEQASSFFLVAEGALEVLRKVRGQLRSLGHLGEGEAAGVFGVFAGAPRAAAVRAAGDATVLEVPGRVLSELMKHHPAAKRALRDFYTERLLENFFAATPIFDRLDAAARAALIGRFTHREVPAGGRLVEPGTVSNAFYLVIRGSLEVTRHAGPGKVELVAAVDRGQFLGVIAALAGHPTVVTATARSTVTVAELSHKAFAGYLAEHPSLQKLPAELEAGGMLKLRELFVGDAGIPALGGT